MLIGKRIFCLFAVMFLSSVFIYGCDDGKKQKQGEKIETVQEKIGKEAAQEMKQPVEEAVKLKNEVETKNKKVLEGC